MPNVGKKEFPYTPEGFAMAKSEAKKSGKKMVPKKGAKKKAAAKKAAPKKKGK
jgi:hypothetical protein